MMVGALASNDFVDTFDVYSEKDSEQGGHLAPCKFCKDSRVDGNLYCLR